MAKTLEHSRDHGPQAALSLQAVLRMLTYKVHAHIAIQKDSPPAEHLCSHLFYSLDDILTLLTVADETIFLVGSELRTSDLHSICKSACCVIVFCLSLCGQHELLSDWVLRLDLARNKICKKRQLLTK